MSLSHKNCHNFHDKSLSNSGDTNIYTNIGGSSINGKEIHFPALHTQTPHCCFFNAKYKLTSGAPEIESSTSINTLLNTGNYPVSVEENPLKIRTDLQMLTNVPNEEKAEVELNYKLQQTKRLNPETSRLENNEAIHETDNGQTMAALTRFPPLSPTDKIGKTDSVDSSYTTCCCEAMDAPYCNGIGHEVDLNLQVNGCSPSSKVNQGVRVAPDRNDVPPDILNSVLVGTSECDTINGKISESVSQKQDLNCRSADDLTAKALRDSKSRFAFPGSSTRNRRQRQIEVEQVHQVYTQIAPHCDNVRQKAWPRVKRFLKGLDPGSIVVDVGCGNGRYLKINSSIFKVGCDLCPPFLEQARVQGHEVMVADNLALPYRDATFDAVISIGVIHHLSSLERRIRAISELSRVLSPGGKLMVYVWAFEQIHRKFESQDVLIPWVKPEIKDQSRRNTVPCLTESSSFSVDSVTSCAPVDDAATPTLRRRHRHESSNSNTTAKHRHRSKSLNADEPSTASSHSRRVGLPVKHSPGLKFGVFDRRDCAKDELERAKTRSVELANELVDCVARSENQVKNYNNSSNDDIEQAQAKWPGQIVSECRKLGQYFRGLSSGPGSPSNDQTEIGDNLEGHFTCLNGEGNSNPGVDASLEVVKYVHEQIPQRFSNSPSTEFLQNVGALSINQNDGINQNMCSPSSDIKPLTGVERLLPSLDSERNINLPLDYYNVSTSVASRTNLHSVQNKRLPSVYTTAKTKEIRQFADVATDYTLYNLNSNSLNVTNNALNSTRKTEHGNTPFFCQLAQSASTKGSSPTSNQEPLLESKGCYSQRLNYLPASSDMFQPLTDTSLAETASESCISGDGHSFLSNQTVTNIQLDVKSEILSTKCPKLREVTPKQTNSYTCGDAASRRYRKKYQLSSSGSTLESNLDQLASLQRLNSEASDYHQHLSNTSSKLHLGYFLEKTLDPLSSQSNLSTDVNYPCSELGDATDCLDSDSVFSLNPDSTQQCLHHVLNHRDQTSPEVCPMDKGYTSAYIEERQRRWAQVSFRTGIVEDYTQQITEQPLENDSTNSKQRLEKSSKEATPPRALFKTFFHKLKDYFHSQPKNESKSLGCYHNGKSLANKCITEFDSSENATPLSSFSTHSSCYPVIFAVSKNHTVSEKNDDISAKDASVSSLCPDDSVFLDISETSTPTLSQILDNGSSREKRAPLKFDFLACKRGLGPDFVDDVIEKANRSSKGTLKHSTPDSYTFNVENLSLATVKKESFFHAVAKKWSGMFNKDGSRISAASNSLSSCDDNEDNLTISLVDNDNSKASADQPHDRTVLKRPTSLDFSKKRTRKSGRRPPVPRADKNTKGSEKPTEYKLQNLSHTARNKKLLTLSDAMTLLGDGATEESIVERLDSSAKTVFLQMKRMNFAIRKFPMSSLDSDSNDDGSKDIPENSLSLDRVESPEEAGTQAKPTPLKMRRDKLIFSSRRKHSDSVTSQDAKTRRRRRTVQRQNEIPEADGSTGVYLLKRQHLSEDLVSFFDSFGIQQTKQDSQYLFTQSLDIKSDILAPPKQPSTESQKMYGRLRKKLYHFTPSCDYSSTFSSFKQGTPLTESIDEVECYASANEADLYDSTSWIERNTELTKSQSEHNSKASGGLINFNPAFEYNPPTQRIKRLVGSYKLCDYGKSLTKEDVSNESSVRQNTNQSNCEGKLSPINSKTSPIQTSTQPASSYPTSQSFACEPANQNVTPQTLFRSQSKSSATNSNTSLSRYYHVFKKGELDRLVKEHVPSLRIVDTFYDHANWCIIAEKI